MYSLSNLKYDKIDFHHVQRHLVCRVVFWGTGSRDLESVLVLGTAGVVGCYSVAYGVVVCEFKAGDNSVNMYPHVAPKTIIARHADRRTVLEFSSATFTHAVFSRVISCRISNSWDGRHSFEQLLT